MSIPQFAYGQAVEICDNAIDDDGDGKIDLNDSDCACPIDLPTSLIPNPSFEDQTSCPDNENQLEKAIPWEQASAATTDYMHLCGFTKHFFFPRVPLPFPDGEGGIGFRNGKPGSPNFKESTGSCLTEPMVAGTLYSLNLWVGFNSPSTSPEFEIVVFGADGCDEGVLPYGNGNSNIGCPLNVPAVSYTHLTLPTIYSV